MPGPRSLTPPRCPPAAGSLVQDLIRLLGESRRLTRAALHLLLVPHLQELSLRPCPSLVSNAIGQLVTVRCKVSGRAGGDHPSRGWG